MASLINNNLEACDDADETVPESSNSTGRPRSSRPNCNLPVFFDLMTNEDEIRSHCICMHDDTIISHFVAVPMDEYKEFLANKSLSEIEKKEWEDKNLLAIPKEPKGYEGTIKKMTVQQLKKLCAKLKRKTPNSRNEGYSSLQAMREEQLGYRTLLGATDRRLQNLYRKSMVMFRFITTILSATYRVRLGQINHGKDHGDHETYNTYKDFFKDVSDTIKTDFASEHQGLHRLFPQEYGNLFEHYLGEDALKEENPTGILNDAQKEFASPEACMSHMKDLVKIYQKMTTDMTVSGIHANDPYLYTENAIAKSDLKSTVSEKVAFYFYLFCLSWPIVVKNLVSSLPNNVRCANHIDLSEHADSGTRSSKNVSVASGVTSKKRKGVTEHTAVLLTMNGNISHLTKILDRSERNHQSNEMRSQIITLTKSIRKDRKMEEKYLSQYISCTDEKGRDLISKAIASVQSQITDQSKLLASLESATLPQQCQLSMELTPLPSPAIHLHDPMQHPRRVTVTPAPALLHGATSNVSAEAETFSEATSISLLSRPSQHGIEDDVTYSDSMCADVLSRRTPVMPNDNPFLSTPAPSSASENRSVAATGNGSATEIRPHAAVRNEYHLYMALDNYRRDGNGNGNGMTSEEI
jgi:hypothetical protein